MAEISFAKNPTTITETQVVPTPDPETNVETVTGSTPAAPTNTVTAVVTRKPLPIGDTIPDFSDIILPRLNIVQKVGQMSEVFPGGAVGVELCVVQGEAARRRAVLFHPGQDSFLLGQYARIAT